MKRVLMVLLAGAIVVVPCGVFAAQAAKPQTQPAAKHSTAKSAPTHSTAGVVKSMDDSSLVITRQGKDAGEMTLTLNASTQRKGTIAVGTPVSVRYHDDGSMHVATAITAQHEKKTATKK